MANDAHKIQAILLAGGRGARLHPYTAVFPKPLMPLGEMPVLEVLLRRLRFHGITDITLCTGHMAELFLAFFGDGERFGVSLRYSREDKPLGTAGPIALAPEVSHPFLVMNGDLLTTLDFRKLLDFHMATEADLTVATYQREVQIDFGVLDVADDKALLGYTEKPTHRFDVSMGVYVCNRSIRDLINPGEHLDIPDLIMRAKTRGDRVMCHRSDCYWLDIGRADDYARAQEEFERDRAIFLPQDGDHAP